MILQTPFFEKAFKKTESFAHSGVLLLFLFTLSKQPPPPPPPQQQQQQLIKQTKLNGSALKCCNVLVKQLTYMYFLDANLFSF